jgi:sugar phosphate isomerase/epimerase
MKTRTGGFPLGFRRGSGEWQKHLGQLIKWAKANSLEVIDLLKDGDRTGQEVIDAGLRIGSIDLLEKQSMISPDRGRRAEAVAKNAEYLRACAGFGQMNYFVVMEPEEPGRPRAENFGYMVDSFGELAPVFEECDARLVIEGWPGPGALCCTPEGYRAFFKEIESPRMGINYDPSHLLRMRIDYLRFLQEFGERVFHVHGKDTQFQDENLYEYGSEQPPTFGKPVAYAAAQMHWRYTIPGHGVTRWVEVLRQLVEIGYEGCISIELEDATYHKEADAEQLGILQGARFLEGC